MNTLIEVREFGNRYGYGMAPKLSIYAQETVIPTLKSQGKTFLDKDRSLTPVDENAVREWRFWETFGKDGSLWSADLKDAAKFLGTHALCPKDIPDASLFEELATKQEGSASLGLQQLNMELKASEGGAQ